MTPVIALMVLASAALHPIWNMLLKGDADRWASWWLFTFLLAAISFTHAVVAGAAFAPVLDQWPILMFSLAGQFIYGLLLIRIYERGDLSAYYPIIRTSPIGIVLISFVLFPIGYSPVVLGGIALTVIGAFWVQKKPGLRLLDDPVTLGYAALAMMGTAIYSLADARIAQHVSPPVLFFAVEGTMTILYLPMMAALGQKAVLVRAVGLMKARPWRHLGAGLICYISYVLILWSYSMGGDVAAVTTVRQASIPISVLIGWAVLKEQHVARRLPASVLMVAGILIVIHGG